MIARTIKFGDDLLVTLVDIAKKKTEHKNSLLSVSRGLRRGTVLLFENFVTYRSETKVGTV